MRRLRWASGFPALLIGEHLKSRGLAGEAVNAAEVIVTDAVFNNASPLMDATEKKANARLMPLLEGGRDSHRDRLQRRDGRWPAHHAGPRRFGFFGFDSRRRAAMPPSSGSGPTWTGS